MASRNSQTVVQVVQVPTSQKARATLVVVQVVVAPPVERPKAQIIGLIG